jgi:RNA polymerase sigma-70 factor, ECF subfamily
LTEFETVREDDRLVSEARKGSQEAFRQLYERYNRKIHSLVGLMANSPEDINDIVQQVFIRAFRSLKNFKGESSFYTWLYRVAVNTTTDFRRRQFRKESHETRDLSGDREQTSLQVAAPGEEGPEAQLYRKELAEIVNKALESLSPEHREVIVLREINGMNYAEIAEVTGAGIGTVMSRLFYARKKLADILQRSKALDLES